SSRIKFVLVLATFSVGGSYGQSVSEHGPPAVVPLHKMRAGQWVEKVWGDPEKPGEGFAIRTHNDAGYIVVSHVHPMDDHMVVVQGRGGLEWEAWAIG